jgi:hypothetical protein
MPVATPAQNQGQVGDTPGPAVSVIGVQYVIIIEIHKNE